MSDSLAIGLNNRVAGALIVLHNSWYSRNKSDRRRRLGVFPSSLIHAFQRGVITPHLSHNKNLHFDNDRILLCSCITAFLASQIYKLCRTNDYLVHFSIQLSDYLAIMHCSTASRSAINHDRIC